MKASRILAAAFSVIVLWGSYRAYRAHENLVTLNVRNMDVRRVVSKLEWQTWERIVVSKNVGGRVTLNVHNAPLDAVLDIVGLQTDSRWTRLYPLYSTRKSLSAFKQVLQGNLPPAGNGWAGLEQLATWQQAGLSGFASTLRAENRLVSAQLVDKDPAFTALALSRFSKAQIVPEEGTTGSINLKLEQVSFDKAVAKMAKQVHRKWDRIYTLQPLNAATLVRKVVPASQPGAPDPSDTNQVANGQAPQTLPPDRALEALVSTMTPEEKQQTIEQIDNASQAAGLSPAQRQQQMQDASSAAAKAAAAAQQDMENRIETRLKDGTVDQRLAHDRRVLNNSQSAAKQ